MAAKASDEIAKKNSAAEGEDTDSDGADVGKTNAKTVRMVKSRLNNIKGSCLYQVSLPEGLTSKTYGALYQHLAAQGSIPLGLFRGTFANMNMGPKANRMPYVFTNPGKETELFSCDRVFVLSTTPQRVAGKVEMKDWLLDIQMQQIRQQKEKGNGDSSTMIGGRQSSHQMKGIDILEKSQKKLDERVTKMSVDMNKKLSTIVGMLERLSSSGLVQNINAQQFTSIAESPATVKSASPTAGVLADIPTEPTSSRSRFNSIDSIASNDLNQLPKILESPLHVSRSSDVDAERRDPPSLVTTASTKPSGVKGGLSFLKRVIALSENNCPTTVVTDHHETQIVEPYMKTAPVEIQNQGIQDANHTIIAASLAVDKLLEDDAEFGSSGNPQPQLETCNLSHTQVDLPHTDRNLADQIEETYEIEMDEAPSLYDSPLRTDQPVSRSSPGSTAASIVVTPEDEQPTSLKYTIKPQISPRLSVVSKKILTNEELQVKSNAVKNNFVGDGEDADTGTLKISTLPTTILGPSIAVINTQSTDRAARIRALRMQNGGNIMSSPSRPLSASTTDYNLFSAAFSSSDPLRIRSNTSENMKVGTVGDKRGRALSAHH